MAAPGDFADVCGKRPTMSRRTATAIDVRPLTILAGANSSGKSSMMQPLLLLKQTLEAAYDPGPLLLNGPNVRFSAVEQFLPAPKKAKSRPSFSVGLSGSGMRLEQNNPHP